MGACPEQAEEWFFFSPMVGCLIVKLSRTRLSHSLVSSRHVGASSVLHPETDGRVIQQVKCHGVDSRARYLPGSRQSGSRSLPSRSPHHDVR